jgi:hypothetical protein
MKRLALLIASFAFSVSVYAQALTPAECVGLAQYTHELAQYVAAGIERSGLEAIVKFELKDIPAHLRDAGIRTVRWLYDHPGDPETQARLLYLGCMANQGAMEKFFGLNV